MRDFFEVVKDDGRPWLILGKGPTAERAQHSWKMLSEYRVFALNHAIELYPNAEIWHFIDGEVMQQVKKPIAPKLIVMPYFPHFHQRPALNSNAINVLNSHACDNFAFYNLCTAPRFLANPDTMQINVVHAQFFSAEAAFELLAKIGVKNIDTLGVDGGSDRAPAFANLPNENPHGSYDKQFANIERIVRDYGITWRKL